MSFSSFFLGLLRTPTRTIPERVCDAIRTFSGKCGKPHGLEPLRFSFSRQWKMAEMSWGPQESLAILIYPVQNWRLQMPQEPLSRPQPQYWTTISRRMGARCLSGAGLQIVNLIGRTKVLSATALDENRQIVSDCDSVCDFSWKMIKNDPTAVGKNWPQPPPRGLPLGNSPSAAM